MTLLAQPIRRTPVRAGSRRGVHALLGMCALMLLSGCFFRQPEESVSREAFVSADGYNLVGDLHLPRSCNGIGLILLHGSSEEGRSLHLYTEMCAALRARNYVVFNVDLRGYGESEKPRRLDRIEDYNFVGDAVSALAYVRKRVPAKDVKAWFFVGHSMGGGLAAHAALLAPDVSGLVSISPGRRIRERFFTPDGREALIYLQRRKSEDMHLSSEIPRELLQPILLSYDIEELAGIALPFPVLLIEGALEPANDLAFSRDWVTSQQGPVQHCVLDGAGHYFGTDVVEKDGVKQWFTTNPEVFGSLIDTMDAWLKAAAAGSRIE